jgi:hypothetical protein
VIIETVDIIEPWLYATLSGDDELMGLLSDDTDRVSGTLSATMLPTPYVTFLLQSPLDVVGVGGIRISTDNLYIVKAVDQTGSWDILAPIARRIDVLLHREGLVMSEAAGSLSCTRERTFQAAEVTGDLQYRHLGGIYRIRASADD